METYVFRKHRSLLLRESDGAAVAWSSWEALRKNPKNDDPARAEWYAFATDLAMADNPSGAFGEYMVWELEYHPAKTIGGMGGFALELPETCYDKDTPRRYRWDKSPRHFWAVDEETAMIFAQNRYAPRLKYFKVERVYHGIKEFMRIDHEGFHSGVNNPMEFIIM